MKDEAIEYNHKELQFDAELSHCYWSISYSGFCVLKRILDG